MSHIYLHFGIKILTFLKFWPKQKLDNRKHVSILDGHYISMIILISLFPITAHIVTSFIDGNINLANVMETFMIIIVLASVLFCLIVFVLKRDEIRELIEDIKVFEAYTPIEVIMETEKRITFYMKIFLIYAFIGNTINSLTPFLTYKNCFKNRSQHMIKRGIGCGAQVEYVMPFKFDQSPNYLFSAQQYISCVLFSTGVITITMLVGGLMMHCCIHLDHLASLVMMTTNLDRSKMQAHINYCVKFHTTIIEYFERVNKSFSLMMLLHRFISSFIISVLGFVMITDASFSDTIRFLLHLTGWFVMLVVVCYYAQILMDKSLDIGKAVYDTAWFEAPFSVRDSMCLMLLRSQKPLLLKASSLSTLSYEAIVGVLYTSYSYFTLIWNLTNK